MVLAASSGIGFLYSFELRKRLEEINELCRVFKVILGDIRYTRASLPEAIKSAFARHDGSYHDFLHDMTEQLEHSPGISLGNIWSNICQKTLKESSLSKQDKKQLIDFGERIGFTDREQQMGEFELFIGYLEEEASAINGIIAAKAKLYRSLGVLIGVFIIIILL